MKIRTEQVIDFEDWNEFVSKTYGRQYNFQQQDDCKDRGSYIIKVPVVNPDDFENESVPEIVNGDVKGVSFKAWLERDPSMNQSTFTEDWVHGLWWERNFYPALDMVANDLHAKGLLNAGKYTINIDW